MSGRPGPRATLGRILIALAVLLPAALIVVAIVVVRSHAGFVAGLSRHGVTTWIAADAALLGIGFWLNRGEEL